MKIGDCSITLPERFWAKVDKTTNPAGCWEWRGTCNRFGYGKLKIRSYVVAPAHRVAWMLAYGETPPDNQCVCHHCDNPRCVRIEHLFVGTDADNRADMLAKGRDIAPYSRRTHCKRGHALTPDNIRISQGHKLCRACQRLTNRKADRKRALRRYRARKADPVKYARMLERQREYDKQRYQARLDSGYFREANRKSAEKKKLTQ